MEQKKVEHPLNYPEEYITGKVTFFGREFSITPDVLIPRLETESLVRRAREVQKVEGFDSIIDIGCGSGIIGTSLADLAPEIIFLDISREALRLAERNFRAHYLEKKAEFIVSDLLSKLPLQSESSEEGRRFFPETKSPAFQAPSLQGGLSILFLANLPYIKGGDWKNMSPDTRFEPELALFGGDVTGFEMYERLFKQIQTLFNTLSPVIPHLSLMGENSYPKFKLIIEFGFDQREIAENLIQSYGWEYEFFADYAGLERFCEIGLT